LKSRNKRLKLAGQKKSESKSTESAKPIPF
jgi:hypothetical protein